MAVERLTNAIVELTRHVTIPRALKPKCNFWIFYAEENEAIGCSESTIGQIIIENERDLSKDWMLHDGRHYVGVLCPVRAACSDSCTSVSGKGTGKTKAMLRSPKEIQPVCCPLLPPTIPPP